MDKPSRVQLQVALAVLIIGSAMVTIDAFPTHKVDTAVDLSRDGGMAHHVGGNSIFGHYGFNSSDLELVLMRRKVAEAIRNMQDQEDKRKTEEAKAVDTAEAECYIEITKVYREPGKCHKVPGGTHICHSPNSISLSPECEHRH